MIYYTTFLGLGILTVRLHLENGLVVCTWGQNDPSSKHNSFVNSTRTQELISQFISETPSLRES